MALLRQFTVVPSVIIDQIIESWKKFFAITQGKTFTRSLNMPMKNVSIFASEK